MLGTAIRLDTPHILFENEHITRDEIQYFFNCLAAYPGACGRFRRPSLADQFVLAGLHCTAFLGAHGRLIV